WSSIRRGDSRRPWQSHCRNWRGCWRNRPAQATTCTGCGVPTGARVDDPEHGFGVSSNRTGSTAMQVAALYLSRPPKPLVAMLVVAAALALGACAPAPIYKTSAATVSATPQQVATSPQNFHGAQVVWAGTVVHVANFPDHSEIEILGYPMDGSQRPRLKQPA